MEGFNPETNQFEETINIKEYIALFWQWAWVIALAALLAGAIAFFVSNRMTPVYQASTTVLVNEAPATKSMDYSALMASERLTRTYAQMITNTPVLDETIHRLGITLSSEDLREMITVKPMTDTQLIQVMVESTDPVAAALIANNLMDIFSRKIQEIESDRFAQSKLSLELQLSNVEEEINKYVDLAVLAATETEKDRMDTKVAQYREIYSSLLQSYEEVRLSEAQSISSVVQIEPAERPEEPISPKVLQNTVLAAAVGFFLASGIIVAREMLDDTLKTPDDVNRYLGLPVLGMIDQYSEDKNERLITAQSPRSPISESFRALRTNVQYASVDVPLRSVLVTSPGPGEGKSTIAANLAVVMAQSGRPTYLMDCDFRRPTMHTYFGLHNRTGLSSLLYQPNYKINGSFKYDGVRNLNIMTTGNLPPNPAELLASTRMADLFAQVKAQANMLVVDSPPILAVTDAAIIAPTMDGVLLVVRPGTTHISAAKQTIEQLRRSNAKILGVVINGLDLKRSRYAYRYGYHYYGRSKYSQYYQSDES